MNTNQPLQTARPLSAAPRLARVREALLALHRTLLQAERLRFERVQGRVSAGTFLEAFIADQDFAWLKPLTSLVLEVDDLIDTPHVDADDVATCLAELQQLLHPDCEGAGFARRYGELLERSPDAVLAHGALLHALR